MTEKTDRKRDAPLSYRPPNDLREEFMRRVEASGLSVNAFITRAVFSTEPPRQSRRPPLEVTLVARLLAQAAGIRDALDKASLAGNHDSALLIEAALQELTAIRAALLKSMGRKP